MDLTKGALHAKFKISKPLRRRGNGAEGPADPGLERPTKAASKRQRGKASKAGPPGPPSPPPLGPPEDLLPSGGPPFDKAAEEWLDDTAGLLDADDLETAETVAGPMLYRRRPRARKNLSALRQEQLREFLTAYPAAGETWHIVSDGRFDYWAFCPVLLDLLGRPARSFYGSTWTMNHRNAQELLDLIDRRRILKAAILTGTYFKRRESAVANLISTGLLARGQRFRAFQNHAKILLLEAPPDFLVLEGSANFTANPRLEQNTLTNDRGLLEFHKEWMEGILGGKSP